MARIYNPEKYGDLYQPRAQSRGFNPVQVADNTQKIKQDSARKQENIRMMARADARQAQLDTSQMQREAEAGNRKFEKDKALVSGLANLSSSVAGWAKQSAADQEKREKEKIENQKIDQLYEAVGGDTGVVDIPQEEFDANKDLGVQANAEASAINETAQGLQKENTPESNSVANMLQQGSAFKQLEGINGNAYAARTAHASYLQEALRSLPDADKPRTAGEARQLMLLLNRSFLKQSGISGNRALVAEVLAPTMLQNTQNQVASLVSAGVKADQANNKITLTNDLNNIVKSTAPGTDVWRAAADGFANSNVGYTGYSEASNLAALDAVLKAAIADKDITLIEQLRLVPKGPGLPTLGEEYGYKLDEALDKARDKGITEFRRVKSENSMATHGILSDYYDNPTPENRQKAYDALMQEGPEGVAAAQKISGAGINLDIELAADIQKRTVDGNPYSNDELQGFLDAGLITSQQYTQAAKNDKTIKLGKTVKAGITAARSKLDAALTGNIAQGSALKELKSRDLNGSMKAELGQRQLAFRMDLQSRLVDKLKQNPDIANDPRQLNSLIFQESEELLNSPEYTLTFQSDGGWSFVGESKNEAVDLGTVQKFTFGTNQQDFRSISAAQAFDNLRVPLAMINPTEDLLIQKSVLKEDAKAILSGNAGGVSANTAAWAHKLGISPKALIDAQLGTLKLPTTDQLKEPTSSDVGPGGDIPNEAAGFSYLQSMGFPRRGSAYLASAISAESSWEGDRSWGGVKGDGTNRNGGLISWASWADNPARLGQIERHFGTSIDKIPENQQLQYMVKEMKEGWPDAYRVFMNPNSASSDLKAAVRGYWGFNPKYTDGRWSGAEKLLGKPDASGSRSRAYTTGNVGPTSTGQHLDIKQVGGGRFDLSELESFIEVDDKDHGTVSLAKLRQLTNNVGDSFQEHVNRGSHGIDVGTYSGTEVFLKNGAKRVSSVPTEHGDLTTIRLPDGRRFTFLHGKG